MSMTWWKPFVLHWPGIRVKRVCIFMGNKSHDCLELLIAANLQSSGQKSQIKL